MPAAAAVPAAAPRPCPPVASCLSSALPRSPARPARRSHPAAACRGSEPAGRCPPRERRGSSHRGAAGAGRRSHQRRRHACHDHRRRWLLRLGHRAAPVGWVARLMMGCSALGTRAHGSAAAAGRHLPCAWGVAGRFGLALQACVLFSQRVTSAAALPGCPPPGLAACLTNRVAAHIYRHMCRPPIPPAPMPDPRLFVSALPTFCSSRLQRADCGQPGPPQLRHAGALCTAGGA